MKIKEFFKPTIGKIIIFILIILILGIPATSHSCSTYRLMPGKVSPQCIDKFNLYSLIVIIRETSLPSIDAYTKFYFNYLFLLPYLIIIYLISCLIIFIYNKIIKEKLKK